MAEEVDVKAGIRCAPHERDECGGMLTSDLPLHGMYPAWDERRETAVGDFNLGRALAAMAVVLVVAPSRIEAQETFPRESDPRVMGWMEGFPPPPERLITQPDSSYFSFPRSC